MFSSFWLSPWSMRPAGMPVQAEITSAMSSAVTWSATICPDLSGTAASASAAAFSSRSRAGISP